MHACTRQGPTQRLLQVRHPFRHRSQGAKVAPAQPPAWRRRQSHGLSELTLLQVRARCLAQDMTCHLRSWQGPNLMSLRAVATKQSLPLSSVTTVLGSPLWLSSAKRGRNTRCWTPPSSGNWKV